MMRLPLFVSALLMTAATDTVWWRSDAGTIIGHRNGDAVTCTLTLEGADARLRVVWSGGMPTRAVVERRAWQFQPGNVLDISVRIGDAWLGRGSGMPNIPAMTGPSTLMFVAREDIEPLLRHAPDIHVSAGTSEAEIAVQPGKMNALMNGVDRCRALIAPHS